MKNGAVLLWLTGVSSPNMVV